ncbi:MAG TPA: RIP metalloprotease RseP [Candidatus Eisenbacteria bacterium]|nr:RIP metalloprotease RseP [Candidatus Eisenbacteria bacterium]
MSAVLALSVPVAFGLGQLVRDWVPGIVVLSVLVLFHEFGHFLVAKRLGVPVARFALGFGPRLFGVKLGGTDYCVCLLPLGGYVSMASEEKAADGTINQVDHFTLQTWWKRALIAVAGPGANLVAGYTAMVVVGLVGITFDDYRPEIGVVTPGSLAEKIGFGREQSVVDVNGSPVTSWKKFVDAVSDSKTPAEVRVKDASGAVRTVEVPVAMKDSVLGDVNPRIEPVVGTVSAGLPAYPAGIQVGDRVVAVNDQPVTLWEDLTSVIHASPGKPVKLRIRRGTHEFDVTIKPTAQQMGDKTIGIIGISPPRQGSYTVRTGLKESLSNAFPLTGRLIDQTFRGLWMLFSRPTQAKDQMGGPLLIMRMSSQQAQRGVADFLFLLGVISVAIMSFNLLPLPILDGGHLVLALLEGVRQKPLAQGFLTAYQRLGLALIGSLIVFILFNDVWREAQRNRADRAEHGQANPIETDR